MRSPGAASMCMLAMACMPAPHWASPTTARCACACAAASDVSMPAKSACARVRRHERVAFDPTNRHRVGLGPPHGSDMSVWLFDLGNTRLKYALLQADSSIGDVAIAAHDGMRF